MQKFSFSILPRVSAALFVTSVLAVGLTTTSVNAVTIIDNFDSTITSNVDAASIESGIQTASNTISSLFSNVVTVNILFKFDSSVHGQTVNSVYSTPYNAYTNLLQANAAANPANTTLATAVAHLNSGNVANAIQATSTNFRALGLASALGNLNSAGIAGGGGTYDAIVSIGSLNYSNNGPGLNSQGVSVVEHQIIEVLGGGGGGSTVGQPVTSTLGPLDLYRYHSSGPTIANLTSTPSYTASSGEVAGFSVDGGATGIAQFNQAGGGSDYGDFANVAPCQIQDAFDCGATPAFSKTSLEYLMLEAIGYDPVAGAVPEPSTWAMMILGFAGIGFMAYRRKSKLTLIAA
jgi:hypothetical protein